MKVRDIADTVNGRVIGNPDIEISGISGINEASHGEITVLLGKKNIQQAYQTSASAIITQEELKDFSACQVVVENPHLALARTLSAFYPKATEPAGIHEQAVTGRNVRVGQNTAIYPFVYIRDNVAIGQNTVIYPHVFIGNNVTIGDGSVIHPNVTIRENISIGDNVIIHSGTVIGSDGFGYARDGRSHMKIPQVGGVIIEDDVEIGANVTVDRATIGSTVICRGTKIDNLVQIAHNVKIGRDCIVVAQAGIGGSAELSEGVILAGQAGIRDHVKIGKNSLVGAQSGIAHDIPEGQVFSGSPGIPHALWMRAQSIFAKLPDYIRRIKALERKINEEG